VFAALLGALLCACGSGGEPFGAPGTRTTTLVLESLGTRDGFVRSDGYADVHGNGPGVGDLDHYANGTGLRMFFCFDLSELPAGAVLVGARLEVFTTGAQGQPYTDLGPVVVDHVEYGDELDASDYVGHTLENDIGVLAAEDQRAYRLLEVAPQVQRDREAGRRFSQFRLRFLVDANLDGGADVVLVEDGERSRRTNNWPQLVLTYLQP